MLKVKFADTAVHSFQVGFADPAFPFHADPDPTFHFDADPDQIFQLQ
jgi:hypothetical protein